MEAQGERLTKTLEEVKQEVEFLAGRDAAEVMQEVTNGEHKPWTYAPKQNQKHYRLPTRPANVAVTPIETILDTEDRRDAPARYFRFQQRHTRRSESRSRAE